MLNLDPPIICFDKKVTGLNNQFLTLCLTGITLALADQTRGSCLMIKKCVLDDRGIGRYWGATKTKSRNGSFL